MSRPSSVCAAANRRARGRAGGAPGVLLPAILLCANLSLLLCLPVHRLGWPSLSFSLSLLLASAAGSGTQCVIPYRGDDMAWRHLKVMGDLGVVAPMPFHPRDMDSIRRATEGSDIVINLIGKVRARARAAASAAASGVDAERASGFSPPAHA